MKLPPPTFLILLALSAATSQASPAQAAMPADTLDILRTSPQLDPAAVDRLYREAILKGQLPALYQRLEATAQSETAVSERSRALLIKALLLWRDGNLTLASRDADRAVALAPGGQTYAVAARIQDASGLPGQAFRLYEKVAQSAGNPQDQASARDRLSLMVTLNEGQQGLASSPNMKLTQASVIALLGQTKSALMAFSLNGDSDKTFVAQARAAEWAIETSDGTAAQTYAWQAFEVASLRVEKRYALSLLLESYRHQGRLDAALIFLNGKADDPVINEARLALMLELQRYNEAITFVREAKAPEIRARLLGVLEASGRTRDTEAEYRRLIAQSPDQLELYTGLATLYLGDGDEQQARKVYADFFTANKGQFDLLTQAARQMIAMGLEQDALSMLNKASQATATAVPANFFLFQSYFNQGRMPEAEAALGNIERLLPPDSPSQTDLADGYENLGQADHALKILKTLESHGGLRDYDQQVHVATLAYETGDFADAYARWLALWKDVKLPARKLFLEKQIIRSAGKAGKLDALVLDLERRIKAGTARQNDLDLLIGIRLMQKDQASAEADIDLYTSEQGLPPIERLKQLLSVYERLQDHAKLNDTLRALVKADPTNAEDYLRQLILSTVLYSDDATTVGSGIDPLLGQLKAVSGQNDVEAEHFAGSVYAMANMGPQSVEAYRRALAESQDSPDILLELVTQLKKQHREAEATAMLQYVAEFATSDDVFAVAIDGLFDIASAPAPGSEGELSPVLDWARRSILQRLLHSNEDPRLYSLLADLGAQTRDFALRQRATDALLLSSGDQMPTVLRELIMLTGGKDSDEGVIPDKSRLSLQLDYERRLLVLQKPFPPDVYADIAGDLLAAGDLAGAQQALAQVSSIGGLVEADQLKGDVYAKGGYVDRALTSYSHALLKDRTNLDLILRTSILWERQGKSSLANTWYWQGLRQVITQQALNNQAVSQNAVMNAQQYARTFLEGMLLTWPASSQEQAALSGNLTQLFNDTIEASKVAGATTLSGNPRLTLLLQVVRRVAEFSGDNALLSQADAQISGWLAADSDARRASTLFHQISGLPVTALPVAAGEQWPLRGLLQQAKDTENFNLSLSLSLDDREELAGVVQQAMDNERARAALPQDEPPSAGRPALLVALIVDTLDRVPSATFTDIILRPILSTPYRTSVLFDVFRIAPQQYLKLEEVAGTHLLSNDELIDLTVQYGSSPLPNLYSNRRDILGDGSYIELLETRLPVDGLIKLYGKMVSDMLSTGSDSMLQTNIAQFLLTHPLTDAQRTLFLKWLIADATYSRTPENRSGGRAAQKLLVLDTLPANRTLLLLAADKAGSYFPDAAHLPAVLRAYFAGDKAGAYTLLEALYADTTAHVNIGNYQSDVIRRYFIEERRKAIESFLNLTGPTSKQAEDFYQTYVVEPMRRAPLPPEDALKYYEKLVSVDDGNEGYLSGLLLLYWQAKDYSAFQKRLQAYVDAHPKNNTAIAVGQVAKRFASAQGTPSAGNTDQGTLASMTALWTAANQTDLTMSGANFHDLFTHIYTAYKTHFPSDPLVQAVERRSLLRKAVHPVEDNAAWQAVSDALKQNPSAAVPLMREIWRNSATAGGNDARPSRESLLKSLPAQWLPRTEFSQPPRDDTPMAAALMDRPEFTAEWDAYLKAMPPESRQQQQRPYDIISRGLIAQARAVDRLRALTAALRQGVIGEHDLHLLATLAVQMGAVLPSDQLGEIAARLRRAPVMAPRERLVFSQLFADGGDYVTAESLLEATLLQMMYPLPDDNQGAPGPLAIEELTLSLMDWRDTGEAQKAWHRLAQRLLNERKVPVTVDLPDLPPLLTKD